MKRGLAYQPRGVQNRTGRKPTSFDQINKSVGEPLRGSRTAVRMATSVVKEEIEKEQKRNSLDDVKGLNPKSFGLFAIAARAMKQAGQGKMTANN